MFLLFIVDVSIVSGSMVVNIPFFIGFQPSLRWPPGRFPIRYQKSERLPLGTRAVLGCPGDGVHAAGDGDGHILGNIHIHNYIYIYIINNNNNDNDNIPYT